MKATTTWALLTLSLFYVASARADMFGSGANIFDIEFATIGDPGNPADTTGDPNPAGSVPNFYRIGKKEVSRDMVTKANAAGNLGISLAYLGFIVGGERPVLPATGVSWNEAARFVNWLNTSQGHQAAYKFSTQPGDVGYDPNENILLWQAGDPGFNPANRFRNRQAFYFLPSVHEWYKAAFYDPNANGGAGGYWDFPTGSDTAPTPVTGGGTPGTAVYLQRDGQGPADINFAGGVSPYGVMGLGGNVYEWEETESDLTNDSVSSFRGVRGGSWYSFAINPTLALSASFRSFDSPVPLFERFALGFRVASIPEPSSLLLAALGAMGLLLRRTRP